MRWLWTIPGRPATLARHAQILQRVSTARAAFSPDAEPAVERLSARRLARGSQIVLVIAKVDMSGLTKPRGSGHPSSRSRRLAAPAFWLATLSALGSARDAVPKESAAPETSRLHYRIDAGRSRFTIETETSGLSSMFGHDHKIGVRDFGGVLSFNPGAPETASLELMVRTDSLRLFDEEVKPADRRDIEATILKVLKAAAYNKIVFASTAVTAETIGDGIFDVRLFGELTMCGARHEVTIPTQVIVRPDLLRATGTVMLRQTDYKIEPLSFAGGTVKVKDAVTLSFDLIATRFGR